MTAGIGRVKYIEGVRGQTLLRPPVVCLRAIIGGRIAERRELVSWLPVIVVASEVVVGHHSRGSHPRTVITSDHIGRMGHPLRPPRRERVTAAPAAQTFGRSSSRKIGQICRSIHDASE